MKVEKMAIDIELAFPEVAETLPTWGNNLPPAYSTDLRGEGYYGLIIRNDTLPEQGDLNELISRFLRPLLPLTEAICDTSSLLRVAFFTSYVSTTVRLNVASLELLTQIKAELELSVYPICEDEEETE